MQMKDQRESVVSDAAKGAVAGGLAVWVMDQVDWYMYDHEDRESRRRTRAVRPGGMDPAHVVANKVAAAFGRNSPQSSLIRQGSLSTTRSGSGRVRCTARYRIGFRRSGSDEARSSAWVCS